MVALKDGYRSLTKETMKQEALLVQRQKREETYKSELSEMKQV